MPLRKTKHKSDEITRIAYRFLALPDDEQKIMFSKAEQVILFRLFVFIISLREVTRK